MMPSWSQSGTKFVLKLWYNNNTDAVLHIFQKGPNIAPHWPQLGINLGPELGTNIYFQNGPERFSGIDRLLIVLTGY